MLANADGGYFAIGFYHIEAGLDCNYSIFMPDSVNLAVYTLYSHVARSFDNDNAFGRFNRYAVGVRVVNARRCGLVCI